MTAIQAAQIVALLQEILAVQSVTAHMLNFLVGVCIIGFGVLFGLLRPRHD